MALVTNQEDAVQTMDAIFQERRQQVPVLAQWAEGDGITALTRYEDMVPLLFPHTTYKSYPESFIAKGQWAGMNRWLESVSSRKVDVDVAGVEDVDGWIRRLYEAGHLVSGSSGTSGKASFLPNSAHDRDTRMQSMLECLTDRGISPDRSWHVITRIGPDTGLRSYAVMREMLIASFARPDAIEIPDPKVRGGHYAYMGGLARMRKALADGTAPPDEIAAFEAEAADRQAETEESLRYFAKQILERRSERMFFNLQFPMMFRLCKTLEELGAHPGDLTGENAMSVGGGLKGMALPADYQQQIFAMLNITPERFLHFYSMQEINVLLPKCLEMRYHVPRELVVYVLDQAGESLAPVSDGQVEGRAAFFDTTVDGRWGGTISGDKIRTDFGTCACGRPGPTIFDDIARYSDLADDDKITCAGTMDAYVRGFIED